MADESVSQNLPENPDPQVRGPPSSAERVGRHSTVGKILNKSLYLSFIRTSTGFLIRIAISGAFAILISRITWLSTYASEKDRMWAI